MSPANLGLPDILAEATNYCGAREHADSGRLQWRPDLDGEGRTSRLSDRVRRPNFDGVAEPLLPRGSPSERCACAGTGRRTAHARTTHSMNRDLGDRFISGAAAPRRPALGPMRLPELAVLVVRASRAMAGVAADVAASVRGAGVPAVTTRTMPPPLVRRWPEVRREPPRLPRELALCALPVRGRIPIAR